ncbi:MAG: serine/threonine protein kinase, partial [Planctomycetes bacterium]|nr:serine/threonine protein kinase [Planctomycetota bacterium]
MVRTDMNDDELFAALREVAAAGAHRTEAGDPLAALRRDYEIGEVLGSGGQGTVHAARRRRDGAEVAVKIHDGDDLRERHRLARVVELVRTLDHPSIAALLDHGVAAGRPFVVEARVHGRRLDAWSRALPPASATARRLAVGEALVRAVAHAHGRGVLHRDIKPSNVLVDADDMPHLIDFGVARGVGPALPVTATADFVGTLIYSAPERLHDPAVAGDVRQDVYSLGVVLHELFAGGPPFAAQASLADLIAETRIGAAPLATVEPAIGAVVARAMHPEPQRRYGTALELAADLERLRRHQPVRARLDPKLYRAWRRFARRPAASTVALLACVTLALLVFAFSRDRMAAAAGRETAAVSAALRRITAPSESEASMPARLSAAVLHLQEVDAEPLLRADLVEKLGRLWLELGRGDRAEPHLRHAREILAREPVADPDRLLELDVAIGRSLAERRRDEGVPLLDAALAQSAARFGPHAGRTAVVRLQLAEALAAAYYRPDPVRAVREVGTARRDLIAAFGGDHPEVAWANVVRHRLASESDRATIEELEAWVAVLRGPAAAPRRFSIAAYALAARYREGDPASAFATALRREAGARLQIAGAWHVADLVRAEAMMRFGLGDAPGAERHARQALALELERHCTGRLPAAALDELVAALHAGATDSRNGADHPLVRGHLQLLDVLGREDWRLAADMQDDARILEQNGDLAAARALLGAAITVTCQDFGRNCPVRLRSLRLLAAVERRSGDVAAAREHLVELWSVVGGIGPRAAGRHREVAVELAA